MTVTIVMSVFNNEDTLPRALESIRDQTFNAWKAIIVNDGSTDRSGIIAEEFARSDPRISIITNTQNLGLARSLNIAWKTAQTSLIARMDADDISLPHRFECQVNFLNENPQVDILGAAVYLKEQGLNELKLCVKPETHAELSAKMYRDTPFFHPVVMMRRSFLEEIGGYDESMRFAQDTDLWLRAFLKYRFHNLPTPLLIYHPPTQIRFAKLYWGFLAIFRNALRNGHPLSKGWYAILFLIGAVWKTLPRQLRPKTEYS